MAKKDKEAQEFEEEVQEPVKPKKKSELSLVTLIGIIGGSVVLLFVLLFAGFWFAVRPLLLPQAPQNPQEVAKDAHGADAEKEKAKDAHGETKEGEEEEFNAHDPLAKFLVTGEIVTNAKNSSQFVIIDLGIFSLYKNEEEKGKAEGGGGHGGGSTDPSAMKPEMASRVKGIVNRILGSMTVDELQMKRDSLPVYFKKELKPIFKESSLKLKDVTLQKFLIQ
jgi:flagellar basal body-associated protein FliL